VAEKIMMKEPGRFEDAFLNEYLKMGFGALSKRDIDLLVFSLLQNFGKTEKNDDLKKTSNYQLSKFLKITQTRLKTLQNEAPLKFPDLLTYDIKTALLEALKDARLLLQKDESVRVQLLIENPMVRTEIVARLKDFKHHSDTSFNSELMIITDIAFGDLIEHMFSKEDKNKFSKELDKKARKETKESLSKTLTKVLRKCGSTSGDTAAEWTVQTIAAALLKGAVAFSPMAMKVLNL
jgi:hypothetical protein